MPTSPHAQSASAPPLFTVELTFPVQSFQSDWKQCSLLANYIAEYAAYQFDQQERAENIVSTIANELLESIVCLAPSHSDLIVRVEQNEAGLHINTSHLIQPELISPYTKFLEVLTSETSDQSYLNLLTTLEMPDYYFNQLGLMMVSHDFGATIVRRPLSHPERICTQLFIPNEEFQA